MVALSRVRGRFFFAASNWLWGRGSSQVLTSAKLGVRSTQLTASDEGQADHLGWEHRYVANHFVFDDWWTAMFLIGSQITVGQQAPGIKRTDLLKTALPEMEGKDMNVWVADISPSASTGRHSHPTPRFVYVIEGAVVYEVDGKQPQTFKTGEAYVEMPGEVHNFRNASTTQPARALGFQYANKGQPLQTNAP